MSDEILERIKRIEKVLVINWKLARAIKRKYNRTTDIFNDNFEILEKNIDRNTHNIDQITETLKELVGDAAKYDEANKDKKKDVGEDSRNNTDIKSLYI